MKKFFLTFLLASVAGFSDPIELAAADNPAQKEETPSYTYWSFHPLHAAGNGIWVFPASMQTPQAGDLEFGKVNGSLELLVPVSRTSYFFPRVTWNTFYLNWDQNPRFNQHVFDALQFSLAFYTIALTSWRWIARFDYMIDPHHMNRPGLYSLYSALLWGCYAINEKWHYHIGSFGYWGMEGSTVYPLIGFDYAPTSQWLLQAIFPIDYSVQYQFHPLFRLSAKVRPLKERWRTDKNQPSPRSIFNYTSSGFELNLHYEIERRLIIEIFGGWNFGGNLYIKDQKGKNALYTKFDGAPYVGANLDFGF